MRERLSKGTRTFVAETKRQIRTNVMREEDAWAQTEKILRKRLEGFPEKYSTSLAAIREFHIIRHKGSEGLTEANRKFQDRFPDDILDLAAPAFRVISQIYSK